MKIQEKELWNSELFSFYTTFAILNLLCMEKFQVPGIFKNQVCYAQNVDNNRFEVFRNTSLVGIIDRENGGWFLDQFYDECLTTENVQLIGQFIDKKR